MLEIDTSQKQMAAIFNHLVSGPLRLVEEFEQEIFGIRFQQHFADVVLPLKNLYGDRKDFSSYLYRFLEIAARSYSNRSRELCLLDISRAAQPDWFQQPNMIGYVAYADRYGGNLKGVAEKIPYLEELGVTYLHLMPLLKPRPGANDGGYAVMDYCEVDPKVGEMADLGELAAELRRHGISLCIDLVLNHTAKEHKWAQAALSGQPEYQDYYLMFPDRSMPDQYENTLREIFPAFAPGSFTYYPQIDQWVWTTFNEYQWDLNYRNPAVFAEMLEITLFLANQGVEVLRLDAVAFMWKRLGTDSENLPESHNILQALRALSKICAPGLLLKAEAIVPPPQLVPYFGQGDATNKECEIAYNNVFMVMLWSALAERKVNLMTHALQQMPRIPSGCSWITYVRGHDDIGWAVTEEDAAAVGLNGFLHRSFLSIYYSGRYEGSFARGATFQHNSKTGDRRISGSLASLAGLEIAIEEEDDEKIDLAIKRIQLLHNLILVYGGIPLIYMGDEIGMLNDLGYIESPDLADDNRWMHRPCMDWEAAAKRYDTESVPGKIFQGLLKLITARKKTLALHAKAATLPVWSHNEHVFGLIRDSARGRLLVLANFSEQEESVPAYRMRELGFGVHLINRLDGTWWDGRGDINLHPYQAVWFQAEDSYHP